MVTLSSLSNAVAKTKTTVKRRITPAGSGDEAPPSRQANRFLAKAGQRPGADMAIESVIGTDDRTRITETELAPWRMICALEMKGAFGSAVGTGWLAGPKTVITAGHCVFSNFFFGGWAQEITLSPGRDGPEFPFSSVTSRKFSSLNRWVNDEDPDFDIGCIHLDEPIGDKLGWFAIGALADHELRSQVVNVSGYPGDPQKGRGTEQWFHSNPILVTTRRRIFYTTDTSGGQSGGPAFIYEQEDSYPLVVGIHAYGVGGTPAGLVSGDANSSPRINSEVFDQIVAWVEADGQD